MEMEEGSEERQKRGGGGVRDVGAEVEWDEMVKGWSGEETRGRVRR